MTEKFREMKIAYNKIFMSIFIAKVITDSWGNVSISLIEKNDCSQPKKRENYWMRTLKTLAPLGLNVESDV